MIYRFIDSLCNNFDCIDSGRLAPHTYFVPFSSRKAAEKAPLFKDRFYSDRVRVLSGNWDFAHITGEMPLSIDTDDFVFDNIFVPSSWESEKFEKFKYLDNYPFKFKLDVPFGKKSNNNTGIYRKHFEISDLDKKYVLSFTKVCGSFEIYVNGEMAGYSKISQADFEITPMLNIGQNELVVVVHKWSEVDVLYGQPRFAMTGIVGDVLLYVHNKGSILDYLVNFSRDENQINVKLAILLAGICDTINISFEKDGEVIYSTSKKPEKDVLDFEFSGEFEMYLPENPYLYDLYLTAVDEEGYTLECVKAKVGFKSPEINGAFIYNGKPVKLKGINYSCQYDDLGKLMTPDKYLEDLTLIKKCNINTIKLNVDLDPVFYEMCDELGFYLVKNTAVDLSFARKNKKLKKLYRKDFDIIAKNIVATELGLISNKACFTLFSFGQEDYDPITRHAIDYMKSEAKVPLIYNDNVLEEGQIVPLFDTGVSLLLEEINDKDDKVLFLSEFARSNGIGCASLKEIDEIIENAPCCIGGCISEFSDRYILGEGYDDLGIFTADRIPYSGAENVKYVYRPLRSRLISGDKIEITNTNYFITSEKYTIFLVMERNGQELSSTQIDAVIEPRESRIFDVALGHLEGDMYLNIICADKETQEAVSREQLPVSYEMTEFKPNDGDRMFVTEVGDNVTVKFDGGYVRISKELGTIVGYNIMGKDMLKAEPKRLGGNCFNTNIYRPFIRNMGKDWEYTVNLQDFGYKKVYSGDKITMVEVQAETICKLKKKDAFIIQDMFKITANGVIDVFSLITPLKRNLPNIDCFGKQIKMPNCFGNVTYYGRGEKDNYIDMYEYAPMGLYSDSVDKVAEKYAIAQESGNHTNVHFVTVTDNNKNGIMIMAKKNPFHLRVKPYSDAEIKRCYLEKHNDYVQSGTYIDINAFVSGIGATEEGGMPIAKYLVKPSEYALQFAVIPLYKEDSFERAMSK
jgi:hypothetical protein